MHDSVVNVRFYSQETDISTVQSLFFGVSTGHSPVPFLSCECQILQDD